MKLPVHVILVVLLHYVTRTLSAPRMSPYQPLKLSKLVSPILLTTATCSLVSSSSSSSVLRHSVAGLRALSQQHSRSWALLVARLL
jgi:hypothetical protein